MKYSMKKGKLSKEHDGNVLMNVKGKWILENRTDQLTSKVIIKYFPSSPEVRGDVRYKQYLLLDHNDRIIACAKPNYAEDENPDKNGWPISHIPKINQAEVIFHNNQKNAYQLIMENSFHYKLYHENNKKIVDIIHRGLIGGWIIEDEEGFSPELLCGIYIFCRLIEQENEFLIV